MARPTTISDERILEAARAVFLEHGLAATTAEVAKRAGVAEGSIFKRFATKAELFKAAMKRRLRGSRLSAHAGRARGMKTTRARRCTWSGLQAVAFFRRLMPLVMLQFGTGKKVGVPEQLIGPNAPPLRALKTLATFIERQIRAGRMRKHEPEIVARMLLGSIQSYVFFEILVARATEDAAAGRSSTCAASSTSCGPA